MLFYFIGIAVIMALSIFLIHNTPNRPRLNSLGYAHLAGCIAGQTQLFLKCGIDLLSASDPLGEWLFWVSLGIAGISALCQLYVLNKGLALHEAVTYVPTYQACLSIYTGVAGGFYFQEFENLSDLQIWLSVLGIFLVCLGLAVPLIIVSWGDNGIDYERVPHESELEVCRPSPYF